MLASLLQQQPQGHPGPGVLPVPVAAPELGPKIIPDDDDAIAVLLSLLSSQER